MLATAFDRKVFFSVVAKDPVDVVTADILASSRSSAAQTGHQGGGHRRREAGLSARTIKRRLATMAGLYQYLIVRGDTGLSRNAVPRGLALRRPGQRAVRGVPLTERRARSAE